MLEILQVLAISNSRYIKNSCKHNLYMGQNLQAAKAEYAVQFWNPNVEPYTFKMSCAHLQNDIL